MTDRPDVQMFLTFLNNLPGPRVHELSPADARAQMIAMGPVAEAPIGDLAVIRDISIPGPAGAIPARLYDARAERGPGPVMVFYHGGGFVIGDLQVYGPYCAEAARQLDLPVISIDYRLAPEHPFPAAPIDCEAAARWIAGNIPCTGLILSGDSAGGNLTVVTAMALRDKPAAVPVIAQFPIYPAVASHNDWPSYRDHGVGKLLTQDAMSYFMRAYAAEAGDVRAAPLDFDQTGMPPTLILTAGFDPLRDQGRAYAAALVNAGVPVIFREAVGNIHGFITLRKAIPSSQDDVTGALTVLKAMIAELA